jgi:long-chain acyl-CoA synthetase
MNMTPTGVLMHQAQTRSARAAIVFKEELWTYERLAMEAERLACALTARGIGPGDRIVLHMMNRPEMIIAYYACFKLGAIVAPLRTALTFAELVPILQRLKPALYIGEMGPYENVGPIHASILSPDRRFVVNASLEERGVQPWTALFAGDTVTKPRLSPGPRKPAVLINTSGTTGQPKFVIHTTETLSESVALMIKNWEFSGDDVMIMPLPMAHIGGLMCFLSFIQVGSPFILLQGFDADTVLDCMERHLCTTYIGFPAHYAALIESQQRRPRYLESLRICFTGADACPIDLQERFTSIFGVPVYNIWATTEAFGNLTFGLKQGPVVRIPKDAQIRLVDENDVDVGDGEIGELLVRGANVFSGYWNDPQATEESMRGGWYHTGDLMRRGERDELWFVSRKKDIIIRGGTNISPAEVEEALIASHPAVLEAVVVGTPDPALGERVFGFVKLADCTINTVVPEILRNVAKRLASYKVPEGLKIVDEIPRNALRKVDRSKLRAMAASIGKSLQVRAAPLPSKRCDE